MQNLYKNLSILLICFIIGCCIILFQTGIHNVLLTKAAFQLLENKVPKVQYVLADENSKPLNNQKYDSISTAENGTFIVSKNSKYGIINNNGKTILPVKYFHIFTTNGYIVACKEKTPQYEYRYEYRYEYANDTKSKSKLKSKSIKYYFFDANTYKLIFTLNSQETPIVRNKDLIEICQKGKKKLVNKKGKNLIKGNYEDIIVLPAFMQRYFEIDCFKREKPPLLRKIKQFVANSHSDTEFKLNIKIKRNGKWGIINLQNEIIIPCKYDEIYTNHFVFYPKDDILKFRVKNNDKYGIINVKGEIIVPLEYEEISPGTTKNISVKKNGKWGIIDCDNNNLLFDFISDSPVIFLSQKIFLVSKIKEPRG